MRSVSGPQRAQSGRAGKTCFYDDDYDASDDVRSLLKTWLAPNVPIYELKHDAPTPRKFNSIYEDAYLPATSNELARSTIAIHCIRKPPFHEQWQPCSAAVFRISADQKQYTIWWLEAPMKHPDAASVKHPKAASVKHAAE